LHCNLKICLIFAEYRIQKNENAGEEGIVHKSLLLYCQGKMLETLNEMTAVLYLQLMRELPSLENCKIGGVCPRLIPVPYQINPDELSKQYLGQLENDCDSQLLAKEWPDLKYEDGPKLLTQILTVSGLNFVSEIVYCIKKFIHFRLESRAWF